MGCREAPARPRRTAFGVRAWRAIWVTLFALFWLTANPAWARPVEVELFEGGEGHQFYEQVTKKCEELYPGLTVDLTCDPAISDKVRMRVLEGNLPEVTDANLDIWSLIDYGQVQPLDQWLDQPLTPGNKSTWRESFLPGALDQYNRDGHTYGIPLVYTVWSVYYNKEMFEQHGWKLPHTWPEYFDLCEKIKAEGIAPVAFQGRYSFYARSLVEHTFYHLAGPALYEKLQQGLPEAFDSPQMLQSLQLLSRLSSQYFEKGYLGMSHTEAQLEFFQGRAAMLFCGSWLFSEMQDNIPKGFQLGAGPLPLPDSPLATPGTEYVGSSYFFVFSHSKNPPGGVDFLKTLTSPEEAGKFAAARGVPVAVRGANESLNPAMADVSRQLAHIKATFGPPSGPTVKGLGEIWNDALGRVLKGDKPQDVTREMSRRAEQAHRLATEPDKVEVRHPEKATAFLLFLLLGSLVVVRSRAGSDAGELAAVSGKSMLGFVLPTIAVFSLFFALPSAVALGAATVRWDGIGPMVYVGLLHFRRLLLESDLFWSALEHNLILMAVPALLVIPLSLFLAALLHREVVGAKVFRVAFFFPNLLGVAGVILWQQLYNPTVGPINRILTGLGLHSFQGFAWLSDDHLYYALIPMAVWSAAGFNMVLFLAAMQAVPQSLYEAAEVNGATEWQKFRFITLPLIRDTLAVATVLMVIGGMKAFEAIWLLTNQAPSSQTHVVGTLMVRSLFIDQRVGQAAALATLLFAVVLVGSALSNRALESGEVS